MFFRWIPPFAKWIWPFFYEIRTFHHESATFIRKISRLPLLDISNLHQKCTFLSLFISGRGVFMNFSWIRHDPKWIRQCRTWIRHTICSFPTFFFLDSFIFMADSFLHLEDSFPLLPDSSLSTSAPWHIYESAMTKNESGTKFTRPPYILWLIHLFIGRIH